MAHGILTVKLCQLSERLDRLHRRVLLSETADRGHLQQEIHTLRRECAQTDAMLGEELLRSKAAVAAVLAQSYAQIRQALTKAEHQFAAPREGCPMAEAEAENKILLAEYALDFAQQAADRALLAALEAIDAQQVLEQQEGSTR